jgi:hypothetical protein
MFWENGGVKWLQAGDFCEYHGPYKRLVSKKK